MHSLRTKLLMILAAAGATVAVSPVPVAAVPGAASVAGARADTADEYLPSPKRHHRKHGRRGKHKH